MGNYELLLFDADGTLFDYDRAEAWSLEKTMNSLGIPWYEEILPVYRQINRGYWQALERGEITAAGIKAARFRDLLERLESPADPVFAGETYLQFLGASDFLIDGTVELLEYLNGRVQLALITNGITKTQYGRLSASGIGKYFDPVIISGEVGYQKPDPRIFDVLFEQSGFTDRRKALIIGDSLSSDMQGGLNSGIDTCWYNPLGVPGNSAVPVTYEIASLGEIPAIAGLQEPLRG